ncbi:NLI interacting factor-like phosphatase [Nitzschia inconspicua]|uniref:NLI interacting factor-like phosphatase n=1 Tax=Nitzschia inconspicua TaxID=303405 RepID=A0A9K3M4F6_9STRA|nr:NLI interacting factor-like phosphatase [Nitzschia inconspicua]
MTVQKTIPIKNNNNNTNNTSAAGVRTIRLPLHEGTTDPSLFQHQQQQQWAQQHYVKLRPHVNDLLRVLESTYEVSAYTAGTKHYAEEVTMVLCRNLVGSHRDRDDVERLRYQVQLQLQMAQQQQQQQQQHHQQQQIIIIINDTIKNNNTNTMDNTDDIGNNNVAAKNKRTNDQMQQQQVQQKQDDKEKEEGNMDMNDE